MGRQLTCLLTVKGKQGCENPNVSGGNEKSTVQRPLGAATAMKFWFTVLVTANR
jgi:hypothetical protein